MKKILTLAVLSIFLSSPALAQTQESANNFPLPIDAGGVMGPGKDSETANVIGKMNNNMGTDDVPQPTPTPGSTVLGIFYKVNAAQTSEVPETK